MPKHKPLGDAGGGERLSAGPYEPAVEDHGDGPAVVLIHGTPLDRRAWDGLIPDLAERHRVVAYDLRGHGSARSVPLPASYAVLADDLTRLLDACSIECAHVVGHSFGGQVAQAFAAAHPDRLSALTVICSRATPYPPFAATADIIEQSGIEAVAEPALRRWFTPDAVAADGPAVRYARSCMAPEAARTLVTAFRLIAGFDAGDALAALPVRARYIAAARDIVGSPQEMRQAAAGARHGEFHLEPDAGHMLPLEAPQRLTRLTW